MDRDETADRVLKDGGYDALELSVAMTPMPVPVGCGMDDVQMRTETEAGGILRGGSMSYTLSPAAESG